MITDVDCTADDAKKTCEKYGVQGYPTIKYFKAGLAWDGEKYEDARELKALAKFIKQKSKKPCQPDSLENCDKKDKAFIESIAEVDQAKLVEDRDAFVKELGDLETEHKEAAALFETQKDEAMATQKRQTDLKEKLSKLQGKVGYKLQILKAKTEEAKKEEL